MLDPDPPDLARARPRVLLADDHDGTRALLGQVLRRVGYEVVETTSTRTLVEHVASWRLAPGGLRPDLVVAEVQMRDGDALAALAQTRLRANGVPFVLMTAFDDEALREAARQFGARAVIDKPFTIDAFLRVVDRACKVVD